MIVRYLFIFLKNNTLNEVLTVLLIKFTVFIKTKCDITDFQMCEWDISQGEATLLNMAMFAGIFLGSPLVGYIADIYGRKTSLVMAAYWFTVCSMAR